MTVWSSPAPSAPHRKLQTFAPHGKSALSARASYGTSHDVGIGVGIGVGSGEGCGVGPGLGCGVGIGVGIGVGPGEGSGVGPGVGSGLCVEQSVSRRFATV